MSTTTKLKLITTAAALLGMMAALGPAEAVRIQAEGQRNFGNNSDRHFNGNRGRQYGHRNHRNRILHFGIPQIRIYSGESNGCAYSYRKWQATGSSYWRSRYYDCRNS